VDIEEFRAQAHRFSDWMASYLAGIERYPVRSQVAAGQILKLLPESCPNGGESMDAIFADFERSIMPGITHWQHPRFFAYFSANSSPPSVLAEMLTATLGAQCMLWETSPAATELELRMMQWLRDLVGLPGEFSGCIQDSASSATLCAILAACNRASAGRFAQEGLAGGPPLVLYTSVDAHSSVEKGARIAGLGAANVRKIACVAEGGMDALALESAIAADRAAGRVPAAIVASFGTTGVGAIDPLADLAAIARRQQVYLHVDGAWAGSALILPEVRALAAGLEQADSFVFNPHKWLLTNFDCSAFFLRNPAELTAVLALTPSYLESAGAAHMPEYRDWSVPLGRRFRALKLWFVLRSYGADGLRELLREHLAWTRRLAQRIEQTPGFVLTTPPRLALLSFRYQPDAALSQAANDALNEALLQGINDSGALYLTKTRHQGRTVIRFMIGQTYTRWHHVEQAWDAIVQTARGLKTQSIP